MTSNATGSIEGTRTISFIGSTATHELKQALPHFTTWQGMGLQCFLRVCGMNPTYISV